MSQGVIEIRASSICHGRLRHNVLMHQQTYFSSLAIGNSGDSDFILAAWQDNVIVIKRRRSRVRRMLRPMYLHQR